jgi:hypothetical protein
LRDDPGLDAGRIATYLVTAFELRAASLRYPPIRYGPAEIDPAALDYNRYERIVEDLGEIGKSVFLNPNPSEEARASEAALAMSFFAPGGDIDRAETVARTRWPGASD